jgi:acetylglutamate synthase
MSFSKKIMIAMVKKGANSMIFQVSRTRNSTTVEFKLAGMSQLIHKLFRRTMALHPYLRGDTIHSTMC